MAKKKELWERQKWDTQASYKYFHTYYLSQTPPRSVGKAFRKMRADKGIKEGKQKGASGSWRNWAQAKNRKSKKIKGAIKWSERAKAYDDFMFEQNRDEWEERREKVRQDDWDLGKGLREIAMSIVKEGPGFLVQRRKHIKGKGGEPDRVIITIALDVNSAVKAGGLASKLQRLASGLETERIIDDSEKSFHVTIEKNENKE